MGYGLEQAIMLYRQIFYSTREESPKTCNTSTLPEFFDHIDKWNLNFPATIIDFGGAFQTGHLHLIQYIFRNVVIYSIDTLYEELDLLVLSINHDETKWCIVPVFSRTSEVDQMELIQSLIQELEAKSSVSNKFTINELQYYKKFEKVKIYDPYSEILDLGNIHFVDSIKKCPAVPCCIFMAYRTSWATPSTFYLQELRLIDDTHTKIDLSHARGCEYDYPGRTPRWHREIMHNSCSGTKWEDVRVEFDTLYPQLREALTVYPLPRENKINWLDANNITKLLYVNYSAGLRSNYNHPMTHLFRMKRTKILWNVDCLNLDFLLLQNHVENMTSAIIQQFIEQHIPGFLKYNDNKNASLPEWPTNFVQECLHTLLGPVTNLRIYIHSEEDILYSSTFLQQLKKEDPDLHIKLSVNKDIMHAAPTLFQAAIILIFESNQDQKYIMVCGELRRFLYYVSTCASLEEIQNGIESSVTFIDALDHEENVKWCQNLSFVYVPASEESLIRTTKDHLLRLGLQDINFLTTESPYLDYNRQAVTSQAIIRFSDRIHYELDHDLIVLSFFDQWIFDRDNCKFTGPVISIPPKELSNFNFYPKLQHPTDTGNIYGLRCGKTLILIKWRN